ncbi:MAG: hypothetical protein KDB80_16840, partial [Planctomycetes bacterium]|nr:hypothetical protein [Planctomycetota bacterium]
MRSDSVEALRWAVSEPLPELGYATAVDAIEDSRGRTVRCTPHRRTVMLRLPGSTLFCKHRSRHPNDSLVEWGNLDRLASLGLDVPAPVFLAQDGARSVVGMRDVAGRPLDVEAIEAERRGESGAFLDFARTRVVPAIRTLHDAGLVFRDLYWNHLFRVGPADDPRVAFVDVERVFAPRLRWRRWIVKDLAGLLSSWPLADGSVPEAVLGEYGADVGLVRDARAKAVRIAGRRPKYG